MIIIILMMIIIITGKDHKNRKIEVVFLNPLDICGEVMQS